MFIAIQVAWGPGQFDPVLDLVSLDVPSNPSWYDIQPKSEPYCYIHGLQIYKYIDI